MSTTSVDHAEISTMLRGYYRRHTLCFNASSAVGRLLGSGLRSARMKSFATRNDMH